MSELYSAKIKRSLFRYSDTETEYFHDINSYLRTGELSDDRTKEELESDIENIDQGFQLPGEYEDSRNNMKVYRGIDRDLGMKINDNVIVKSFISTSTDIEQAFHFTNFNSNCCLFELHLEDNIPYIDMKIYNPHEKEILLPRNLLMTYVGERDQTYNYAGYKVPVYIMKISRPPEITLDVVPSAQGGRRKKTYRKRSGKHNKTRRHGGTKKTVVDKPQQVEVSDKTSFSQSLKSGFGSGLGFGAAFEAIKWIFGSDNDSSDE
jgi:hypothetical protein